MINLLLLFGIIIQMRGMAPRMRNSGFGRNLLNGKSSKTFASVALKERPIEMGQQSIEILRRDLCSGFGS